MGVFRVYMEHATNWKKRGRKVCKNTGSGLQTRNPSCARVPPRRRTSPYDEQQKKIAKPVA